MSHNISKPSNIFFSFWDDQNSVLHNHSLPHNKGCDPSINNCLKPTDIKVNKSVKCSFFRLNILVLRSNSRFNPEKNHISFPLTAC